MSNRIKILISNKPYSIPVEMRPLWRISLVILIVKRMNELKKTIDLKKLNIMLWVIIRDSNWQYFKLFMNNKDLKPPFISSDQANYIAIELAFNKNLIYFDIDKIFTTSHADNFYNSILENKIFSKEIYFLDNYLSKITYAKIDQMLGKK